MAPSSKKAGKGSKPPATNPKAAPAAKAAEPTKPPAKEVGHGANEFRSTEKLISPTKSKNSPGDLQLRLRKLYEQLTPLKALGFKGDSLTAIAKELIQPHFTSNKDDGVRVLTGCCIAEVMRLSVQNLIYEESEIGIVFHLFLDLFKKLSDQEGPFSQFYTSVLHSVASLKMINIMDTSDEQLVQDYFLMGFKLVESKLSREKSLRLVDILEHLAENTDNFTTPVIETILKQFTKKRQVEFPHVFALARTICNSAPDRLQGPICQYLIDVLSCTKDDEEEESRPTIDLEQAHEMLQMLYAIEPRILLSVIPQLEAQLTVVRADLRRLSLVTLGTFLILPSAASLLSKYPTLWKSWIQRRTDQDAQIRVLLVQQCAGFFRGGTPGNLLADVCDAVVGLVVDQDEKVRAAACQMVVQLPYASVKQLVPATLLREVAKRLKDKKGVVRRNLPQMLAALYAQATKDLDQGDLAALDKFKWIPEELLEIVYSNDPQIILESERAFRNTILGSVDDLQERTENLLRVVAWLQQRAYVGLRALQNWQTSLAKDFQMFLAACRKLGGEPSDLPDTQEQLHAKLNLLVKRMLQRFPEPQKMFESLMRYPKSSDRKLNDLLEAMLQATSPAAAQLAEREAMKRIDKEMPALNEVFATLLLRLGQTLICRDMVPILMDIATQGTRLSPFAHQVLKDLPAIDARLFEGHVQRLGELLLDSDGADWLPTLAHYAKVAPTGIFPAEKVAKRLARFVLEGTAAQARDAATALSQFDSNLKHSTKTVQSIVAGLSLKSPHLAGHLAALGELVAKHPELTEKHMHAVLEFVLKTLLPSSLELLDAKTNAISMLTSRSIAYAGDSLKQRLVQPVLGLLWSILKNEGEVATNSSPDLLAQMRLSAATAILDLSTCSAYESMVTPLQFNLLATTIQDRRFTVREKFGEALMSRLGQRKLPFKFLVVLFLAAFDPELSFKERVKSFSRQQFISHASSSDSARAICSVLTRLLHLLAHDSEFTTETKNLQETSKFIEFFLAAAATHDNISLIYSAAGHIKRTEDVLDPPLNKNLYTISDLAVHVINSKRLSNGWTITPYPGAIQLPKDLFRPISRRPDEQKFVNKSYLPADFFSPAGKELLTPNQFRDKLEKQAAPKPAKEKEAEDPKSKGSTKRPAEEPEVVRKNATRKARTAKKPAVSDDGVSDDEVSLYKSD